MADISISLSEKDIEKAISFWLECGMPDPEQSARVLFRYDPITGHPTDPGSGVTASATHPDARLAMKVRANGTK